MIDISLEKFYQAQSAIKGRALATPLVRLNTLTTPQGHSLIFKAECLQPSGSFKFRGATYAISQLSQQQKAAGVVTYSTGNHSQAVALASRQLGIHATIVMSPDAPDFKIASTKSYGADVIMVEPSSNLRKLKAEELAQTKGYSLIAPYDDVNVITGQGTIGIEILHSLVPAAVFVPVGGGGLIAGIAMAIKKLNPDVKVIGVEPKLEDDAYRSFKEGKRIALQKTSTTLADAIRVSVLGEITYPLICHYVDDMITVDEQQIAQATLTSIKESHLFVEPAGALALAGALIYPTAFPKEKPIVCIASGGNSTVAFLHRVEEVARQ